ncbi:MAG TPA: heliorhodopsin HeR [Candidatus Saccharimonadales bacterium]|nr:heliorhodopsin HeR [Candidatus Saccharimonadales bacterium]
MSAKITTKGLVKFNLIMAALHAVQAFAVWILSDPNKGVWQVTGDFLTLDTSASVSRPELVTATQGLFSLNLAYIVVAFLLLSAIAHLFVATVYRKRYEAELKAGINKVRWFEYALSASTMMVGISLLSGIYDLSTLIMIFGLTAIMNLCGLAMEFYNQKRGKISWLTYNIGTFAGLLPWVVITIYFWMSSQYGGGDPPTFVYYIYVSIFLFFNCFAINMILQYKQIGKWRDYLYGERAYIILSLAAKSALAWQVFAGTLRP